MSDMTYIGELIADDVAGFACSKSKLVSDGLLHLRPFNVSPTGQLDLSERYQVPLDEAPKDKRRLEAGDILFNNTNSVEWVGKSALIREPMEAGFSNHMTRVRVDRSRLLPEWFAYWLSRKQAAGFFAANATQWVSQAAYRIADLKKIEVHLPPIAEQQRIVGILDRASGIQRLRKAADDKVRELVPALFVEMFGDPASNPKGWDRVGLDQVLSGGFKNGLYLPKERYSADGVEMVHMSDVFYGTVKRGRLKRVALTPSQLNDWKVTSSDLLLARRSLNYSGAAKTSLLPSSSEPLVFESSLIRLTPNLTRVTTSFLHNYLSNPSTRKAFVEPKVTGVTIYGINQASLASIPVMIPPLASQIEFGNFVSQIESSAELCSSSGTLAAQTEQAISATFFR